VPTCIHLVYVEGTDGSPMAVDPDTFELAPGLVLVASGQTRSRLYHAIKRRLAPARLLVVPLSEGSATKLVEL
jgi:hypothetical protein